MSSRQIVHSFVTGLYADQRDYKDARGRTRADQRLLFVHRFNVNYNLGAL